VTDADTGIAYFYVTSTVSGQKEVTADLVRDGGSSDQINATVDITFDPGDPDNTESTVTVEKGEAVAGHATDKCQVKVEVLDSWGNGVLGQGVDLEVKDKVSGVVYPEDVITTSSLNGRTDKNGSIIFFISSGKIGTREIVAWIIENDVEKKQIQPNSTYDIEFTSGGISATSSTVEVNDVDGDQNGKKVVVGNETNSDYWEVTVTARNAFDAPVGGYKVRLEVIGSLGLGAVSVAETGEVSHTATTSSSGEAVYKVKSTESGIKQVKAYLIDEEDVETVIKEGSSDDIENIEFVPGEPDKSKSTINCLDESIIVNDESTTVTITARDAYGNEINGLNVGILPFGGLTIPGEKMTNTISGNKGVAEFTVTAFTTGEKDIYGYLGDTDTKIKEPENLSVTSDVASAQESKVLFDKDIVTANNSDECVITVNINDKDGNRVEAPGRDYYVFLVIESDNSDFGYVFFDINGGVIVPDGQLQAQGGEVTFKMRSRTAAKAYVKAYFINKAEDGADAVLITGSNDPYSGNPPSIEFIAGEPDVGKSSIAVVEPEDGIVVIGGVDKGKITVTVRDFYNNEVKNSLVELKVDMDNASNTTINNGENGVGTAKTSITGQAAEFTIDSTVAGSKTFTAYLTMNDNSLKEIPNQTVSLTFKADKADRTKSTVEKEAVDANNDGNMKVGNKGDSDYYKITVTVKDKNFTLVEEADPDSCPQVYIAVEGEDSIISVELGERTGNIPNEEGYVSSEVVKVITDMDMDMDGEAIFYVKATKRGLKKVIGYLIDSDDTRQQIIGYNEGRLSIEFKPAAASISESIVKSLNTFGFALLGEESLVRADVVDDYGNVIEGEKVYIRLVDQEISGEGVVTNIDSMDDITINSNPGTTSGDGVADFGVSSTVAGRCYIYGYLLADSQSTEYKRIKDFNDRSVTVRFIKEEPNPENSIITLSKPMVKADNDDLCQITVTANNNKGYSMAGEQAYVLVSTKYPNSNVITAAANYVEVSGKKDIYENDVLVVETDSSGEAVFELKSTKAEIKTVEAYVIFTDSITEITKHIRVTGGDKGEVTFIPGPATTANSDVEVMDGMDVAVAGSEEVCRVKVTAKDANDNTVPNKRIAIQLDPDDGIIDSYPLGNVLTTLNTVEDHGTVIFEIKSTKVKEAKVFAYLDAIDQANKLDEEVNISFISSQADREKSSVSLTIGGQGAPGTEETVAVGSSDKYWEAQVAIKDQYGSEVADETVLISVEGSSKITALDNEGSEVDTNTAVTDAAGKAVFRIRSEEAGRKQVKVYLGEREIEEKCIIGDSDGVGNYYINFMSGPARELVFSQEPPAFATVGENFSPAPKVQVKDEYGNLCKDGVDAGITVSLSDLTETLDSAASVAGEVIFNNVRYRRAGEIKLKATAETSEEKTIEVISEQIVNVSQGNITDVVVNPETSVVGIKGIVNISFTTVNGIPAGGSIEIVFPAGYKLETEEAAAGYSFEYRNEQLAVAISNSVEKAAGAAVELTIDNVKNPNTTGNKGGCRLITYVSIDEDIKIDEGDSHDLEISNGGLLENVSVEIEEEAVSARGSMTMKFTPVNDIPMDGKIVIDLPQGFEGIGEETAVGSSNLAGSLTAVVTEETVTIIRGEGAVQEKKGEEVSVVITNIRNSANEGEYTVVIKTQSAQGEDIDTGESNNIEVIGFSLEPLSEVYVVRDEVIIQWSSGEEDVEYKYYTDEEGPFDCQIDNNKWEIPDFINKGVKIGVVKGDQLLAETAKFQIRGKIENVEVSPTVDNAAIMVNSSALIGWSVTGDIGEVKVLYAYSSSEEGEYSEYEQGLDKDSAEIKINSGWQKGESLEAQLNSYVWEKVADAVAALGDPQLDPDVWMKVKVVDADDEEVYGETQPVKVKYCRIVWQIKEAGGEYVRGLNLIEEATTVPYKLEWKEINVSGRDIVRYYPYNAGQTDQMYTIGFSIGTETISHEFKVDDDATIELRTKPLDVEVHIKAAYSVREDAINITAWLTEKGQIVVKDDNPDTNDLENIEVTVHDSSWTSLNTAEFEKSVSESKDNIREGIFTGIKFAPQGGLNPEENYNIKVAITHFGDVYTNIGYPVNVGGDIYSYEAYLRVDHNKVEDKLLINVSLKRNGNIIKTPGDMELEIYKDKGSSLFGPQIYDGYDNSSDTAVVECLNAGVYSDIPWPEPGGIEYDTLYYIKGKIDYMGKSYEVTETFLKDSMKEIASKISDISTGLAGVDGEVKDMKDIISEVVRVVDSSAGKIEDAVKEAAEEVSEEVSEEVKESAQDVVEKITDSAETLAIKVEDIQSSVGEVEEVLDSVSDIMGKDLPERLTADMADRMERLMLSRILNRAASTVMPGDTTTIQYKAGSSGTPTVSVYDGNNDLVLKDVPMENVGGLHEYDLEMNPSWGTGDFTVVCSEATKEAVDSMVLTVTAEMDRASQIILERLDELTALTANYSLLAKQSTQDVTTQIEDLDLTTKDQTTQITSLSNMLAYLMNIRNKLEEMDEGINEFSVMVTGEGAGLPAGAGVPLPLPLGQAGSVEGQAGAGTTAIGGTGVSMTVGAGEGVEAEGEVAVGVIEGQPVPGLTLKGEGRALVVEKGEVAKEEGIIEINNKIEELRAVIEMLNKLMEEPTDEPVTTFWFEED
jgi:gas vesicle protein